MAQLESIETRTETITLGVDGIVRCVVRPGARMSLEDARQNIAAVAQVGAGQRVPVLVDGRRVHYVSREARDFLAGEEVARVQSACALWVSSPVSVVIANFFLGINKPQYPTRLFSSEHEAVAWLRAMTFESPSYPIPRTGKPAGFSW